MTIPFVDPQSHYLQIADEVEADVLDVLRSGQYVGGHYLDRLERSLADYLNVQHVVGVSDGTAAVMLACEALGLKRGDHVVVPNNSFVASAYGVSRAGMRPVFADVHPDTYLLDLVATEKLLKQNRRIRAVMVVDLYGQMPDLEAFRELCSRYNVYLIEDAAQAVGATYERRPVGHYPDVAATSFYPTKNLGGVGQGGAVITNNSTVAANARLIANQGAASKYDHICLGGNFRMDAVVAAHLYHALACLDDWNDRRRKIALAYNEYFSAEQRPTQQPNSRHIYHLYVLRCRDKNERDRVAEEFRSRDIGHGFHYPHLISDVAPYSPADTPVAHGFRDRTISLPMHPFLKGRQVVKVVEAVRSALGPPAV